MDNEPVEAVDAELVEDEESTGGALTVVQPQALEALERAEVDIMIARADRKPRPEMAKIRKRMLSLATMNPESCFYTLKRRDKDGKIKLIQGPSIRMAELASYCFRNLRATAYVTSNDGKKITARGVAYDVENNVAMQAEVSRRIVGKNGRPYSVDMQIVTENAACAIAKRNAIFEIIPRVLVDSVYEQIKKEAVGTEKTLEERRTRVLAEFAKMGVTQNQILRLLEKEYVESIDLEALELIMGLGSAIKDKMTTIAEVFETEPGSEEEEGRRRNVLRDMARAATEKKEATKK